MLGTQERWQEELFVAGPLSSLVPDDHILKQVDKVLDLSWLRGEVKDLYCMSNGRPGIDPDRRVRLFQVWAQLVEMKVGRNGPVPERQDDLDHTGHPG